MSRPPGAKNRVLPIADLRAESRRYVTALQLADYWGCHVSTVRQWVRVGSLPSIRVGRLYRIRVVDAMRVESHFLRSIAS